MYLTCQCSGGGNIKYRIVSSTLQLFGETLFKHKNAPTYYYFYLDSRCTPEYSRKLQATPPLRHALSIKDARELVGLNALSSHLPYHGFWDYEGLEAREINGKTPKPSTSKSATLNAGSLKKSSTTYRTNALSGQTYTKGTAGKVQTITTPSAPPTGKDADHILEAQTVSKALQKGGYKQTSDLPGTSHQEIKDALNHSSNMALVDSAINRSKGQANKSALSGKAPAVNSYVHDYVKQTAQASKDTAKAIDDSLTKHGITGVSVQGEQNNVFKQMGLKRELMLDELDQ